MTALTMFSALEEMGGVVLVMPEPESGPPQTALSMIWPPCDGPRSHQHASPGIAMGEIPDLGIPDKHNLRVRTPLMEAIHSTRHRRRPLRRRVAVADAAARRLAPAGRVADGLGGGAGVGVLDEVDDGEGRAVSGGDGRLARAKDVHRRAGLSLLCRLHVASLDDVDRGAGR